MRKVYLTEKQYVEFVLNECFNRQTLNESILEEGKVLSTLFNGCKTFGDYARRVIYIATTGLVVNLMVFRGIINNIPFGTPEEKQELLAHVEQTLEQRQNGSENVAPVDNVEYADSFNISQNGISHIEDYEKCNLKPYYATPSEKKRGILTIGWGHKITANDPTWLKTAKNITQEQANSIFTNDMKVYENEFAKIVSSLTNNQLKNPEIYPQGFIDAAISMLYNSGMGNFKSSEFFKTWNNCRIDPKTNKIRLDDYNYTISKIPQSCITQKGKVIQGLVNRRNAEFKMANVYK